MIGKFKDAASASDLKAVVDQLTELLCGRDTESMDLERYSEDVMKLLWERKIYCLGPGDLPQFGYDVRTEVKEGQFVVTTDETDVSAFFKLMIDKGARIEVYSAHDYRDTEHGR